MSFSSFHNNTFHLNNDKNRGGACMFYTLSSDSGLLNSTLVSPFPGYFSHSQLLLSAFLLISPIYDFLLYGFLLSPFLLFIYFLNCSCCSFFISCLCVLYIFFYFFIFSVFSVVGCVYSNHTHYAWVGGFLFFFF
jgi:hypothetical protein